MAAGSGSVLSIVCKVDAMAWPLFHWWFVLIVIFVFLFFVVSATRYINFANWYRQFQSEFKLTDDRIISMMRHAKEQREDYDDIAKNIYRKYKVINPIIGTGERSVAIQFFASGVVALVLVLFISARYWL